MEKLYNHKIAGEWETGLHGSGTVNHGKDRPQHCEHCAHTEGSPLYKDEGQKKPFHLEVENHQREETF